MSSSYESAPLSSTSWVLKILLTRSDCSKRLGTGLSPRGGDAAWCHGPLPPLLLRSARMPRAAQDPKPGLGGGGVPPGLLEQPNPEASRPRQPTAVAPPWRHYDCAALPS
eukprot:scaffold74646_cov66-Phaeocystis_antarctica.AAC.3